MKLCNGSWKEELLRLDTPITKGQLDAMDIEKHLDITLCDDGYFHGDLQIGSYRSLLTEATTDDLKFRMATQLRDRVWYLVTVIEREN